MGHTDDSTVRPEKTEQHSQDVNGGDQKSMSRRQLLVGGSLATMALAFPNVVNATKKSGGGESTLVSALDTGGNTSTCPPFRQPDMVFARNGVLTHRMVVLQNNTWTYICNGKNSTGPVRLYNNNVPGATLYVDPGTRMDIDFQNMLPPDNGVSCPATGKCNNTNLHTHGLFVSPSSVPNSANPRISSDDVLVDIPPGGRNRYCVWLPDIHAPGTHWYHAHRHGSTALQVSNGMAGTIIIREPQPLVPQDQDFVWLVQEVVFGDVYGKSATQDSAGFFVNGVCKPIFQMPSGQVQRWRFVNATGTPRGLMKLRLVKCSNNPFAQCNDSPEGGEETTMHLIAFDGISFYGHRPIPVTAHLMAQGNRSDFLVKLQPGMYKLIKGAYPADAVSLHASVADSVRPSVTSKQVLGFIRVFPSPFNDPIPTVIPGQAPHYLQPITSATKRPDPIIFRNLAGGTFQVGFNGNPPVEYESTSPGVEVNLGAVEEWELQNQTDAPNAMVHPFHIHVNPFQNVGRKIDPNGPNDPSNWMWQDVVGIPNGNEANPGIVKMRSRFLRFNGRYVLHCHILTHEDKGMMVNVTVNGQGEPPCRGQTNL